MNDLTIGSIARHLLALALPVLAFMVFQALYLLIDLFFVARLGGVAIAGVSLGGNLCFVAASLTQVLGVGATALIAQAAGRKDPAECSAIFSQAMTLAVLCGAAMLVGGYSISRIYVESLAADAATVAAGLEYLRWYMPALGMQFVLLTLGSSLRGIGVVRPAMRAYIVTVAVNILLAPVLISGWGTGRPLGVAGAGLATSLGVAAGMCMLLLHMRSAVEYLQFDPRSWRHDTRHWGRILNIGLPAGAEMLLLFASAAVVNWAIRGLGPAAQAGFGIGSRLVQVILLPMVAISLAAGPIVGQNFGAGNLQRVTETFRVTVLMTLALALVAVLPLQFWPGLLARVFTSEPDIVFVAASFLQVTSLAFVARALIYACTGAFQGLGATAPSLVSSTAAAAMLCLTVTWQSAAVGFRAELVWYVFVVSAILQAGLSALLLRSQLKRQHATTVGRALPA